MVRIESFFGREIKAFITHLAKLRIEVFRDFPYLYDGSFDYEMYYLKIYPESKESVLVAAFDDDQLVGAGTALPLRDEADYVREPFLHLKDNSNDIYYFAESVLKKEYRGLGLGHEFFNKREEAALQFRFKKAAFCSVVRSPDHPAWPSDYRPLDHFWTKRGFNKKENIMSSFSWKDIGDEEETSKQMIYWMKDL